MRKTIRSSKNKTNSSAITASSQIVRDMEELSNRLPAEDRGKLEPIPAYIYNMGDGRTCIAFDDPNGGPSMIVGDFEAEEFYLYDIAESWGIEGTQ